MPSILGQGFDPYVSSQINDRQDLIGKTQRTQQDMTYMNSRESWLKLSSGSEIEGSEDLSKSFALFNGTYLANYSFKDSFGIYKSYDTADPEFGIVPMPGLISAEVKALNRGSIKEAKIKLKVNSRYQFIILDKLYLRLGYSMLLEWGWNIYVDNGDIMQMGPTLSDNKWFDKANDKKDYTFWLKEIQDLKQIYKGNYDAMFGKVVNFNWSFQPDGSYDIELKLISHGDIIESLRTIPPGGENGAKNRMDVVNYFNTNLSQVLVDGGLKAASFDFQQFTDEEINANPDLASSDNKAYYIDTSLIRDKLTEHLFAIQAYGWAYNNFQIYTAANGDADASTYVKIDPKVSSNNLTDIKHYFETEVIDRIGINFLSNPALNSKKDAFFLFKKPDIGEGETEIPDLECLETPVYVRFGYLLWFLNQHCLPVHSETGNPPFSIDYSKDKEIPAYIPPQQLLTTSYHPSKYIVSNQIHAFSTLDYYLKPDMKLYSGLEYADVPLATNIRFLDVRNVYCNITNLLQSIPMSLGDDKQFKIDLFGFLKGICDGINAALGGINNIEPIIDDTTNTLIIQDSTNFPEREKILELLGLNKKNEEYLLQIFGYRGFNGVNQASFVRDVKLETKISKEMASLITIGATANGTSPGTDSTAFSKLNKGTKDRFVTEYISPETSSALPDVSISDQIKNSANENSFELLGLNISNFFGGSGYVPSQYASVSDYAINFLDEEQQYKNMQTISDYFQYHEGKLHKGSDVDGGGPGIGFLPFELQLDMDGLSGIKIYNSLRLDTSFMPPQYPSSLEFVLAGVDHSISDNDWVTKLRVISVPKTDGVELPVSTAPKITPTRRRTGVGLGRPQPSPSNPSLPTGGVLDLSCPEFFKFVPESNGLSTRDRNELKNRSITYLEYKGLSSTSSTLDLIKVVVAKNEGGYFHPLHFRTIDNGGNISDNNRNQAGSSRETLWGEDRIGENSNQDSRAFWAKVDSLSGYGGLNKLSRAYNKNDVAWKNGALGISSNTLKAYVNGTNITWKYQDISDWDNPKSSRPGQDQLPTWANNINELKTLKQKMVSASLDKSLKQNFLDPGPQYRPLYDLINSSPTLKYLYLRARYNGPGYFQDYARYLRSVWDTKTQDPNELACAHLKYIYNYWNNGPRDPNQIYNKILMTTGPYTGQYDQTYASDVKKIIDYLRYKPSISGWNGVDYS